MTISGPWAMVFVAAFPDKTTENGSFSFVRLKEMRWIIKINMTVDEKTTTEQQKDQRGPMATQPNQVPQLHSALD